MTGYSRDGEARAEQFTTEHQREELHCAAAGIKDYKTTQQLVATNIGPSPVAGVNISLLNAMSPAKN